MNGRKILRCKKRVDRKTSDRQINVKQRQDQVFKGVLVEVIECECSSQLTSGGSASAGNRWHEQRIAWNAQCFGCSMLLLLQEKGRRWWKEKSANDALRQDRMLVALQNRLLQRKTDQTVRLMNVIERTAGLRKRAEFRADVMRLCVRGRVRWVCEWTNEMKMKKGGSVQAPDSTSDGLGHRIKVTLNK